MEMVNGLGPRLGEENWKTAKARMEYPRKFLKWKKKGGKRILLCVFFICFKLWSLFWGTRIKYI